MDTGGSPAGGREEAVDIPPHGRCSGVTSCIVVKWKILLWRKVMFRIFIVLLNRSVEYLNRHILNAQFLATFGRKIV